MGCFHSRFDASFWGPGARDCPAMGCISTSQCIPACFHICNESSFTLLSFFEHSWLKWRSPGNYKAESCSCFMMTVNFKRTFINRGYLRSCWMWCSTEVSKSWDEPPLVVSGIWKGQEAHLHASNFYSASFQRFGFLSWKVSLVWERVQAKHNIRLPKALEVSAWFQGRGWSNADLCPVRDR